MLVHGRDDLPDGCRLPPTSLERVAVRPFQVRTLPARHWLHCHQMSSRYAENTAVTLSLVRQC